MINGSKWSKIFQFHRFAAKWVNVAPVSTQTLEVHTLTTWGFLKRQGRSINRLACPVRNFFSAAHTLLDPTFCCRLMSTADSALLSMSCVVSLDIVKAFFARAASPRAVVRNFTFGTNWNRHGFLSSFCWGKSGRFYDEWIIERVGQMCTSVSSPSILRNNKNANYWYYSSNNSFNSLNCCFIRSCTHVLNRRWLTQISRTSKHPRESLDLPPFFRKLQCLTNAVGVGWPSCVRSRFDRRCCRCHHWAGYQRLDHHPGTLAARNVLCDGM